MNLVEIAKLSNDEGAAYAYLEGQRWPTGPVCPHCGTVDQAGMLSPGNGERRTRTGKVSYRRVWKCYACRQQFSVLVGTIFEDSKVPLHKWLLAIHKMCSGKNGVSAHELHRDLGVTYKTAWFMAHRIRYAMTQPPLVGKLSGVVEADETYVGGKDKKPGRKGKGSKKTTVLTLVQRNGQARSQVIDRVTGQNIKDALKKHVEPDTMVVTDSFPSYRYAPKDFAGHEIINHLHEEYARTAESGLRVHTNTVEGFFGQLKRSIDGTYHHVSGKHLHRYLAEFDHRYNTRKEPDGQRVERTIRQTAGKRLMYRAPLDGGPAGVVS